MSIATSIGSIGKLVTGGSAAVAGWPWLAIGVSALVAILGGGWVYIQVLQSDRDKFKAEVKAEVAEHAVTLEANKGLAAQSVRQSEAVLQLAKEDKIAQKAAADALAAANKKAATFDALLDDLRRREKTATPDKDKRLSEIDRLTEQIYEERRKIFAGILSLDGATK